MELYHGKGLMSTKLYKEIYAACDWPTISEACDALLEQSSKEVGPHNVVSTVQYTTVDDD